MGTKFYKKLSEKEMQIFVGDTPYVLDETASVETLKCMIENREFIPVDQIRLVNGSAVLEDGMSLTSSGIEDDDALQLMLEVQGGMRKKWKKKRMRRLRRKRRKMRQRAR